MHLFESTTLIKRPIEEVFDFFGKAENLNELTPPFLHFKILSALPLKMQKGTRIDYSIRLNGIPFRWKTLISEWNPMQSFVDEQIKGPYKVWKHTHKFEKEGEFTRMTDSVFYQCPGGFLESWVNRFFVRKKMEQIFSYRKEKLQILFP